MTTENEHGYRIETLGPHTWDAFADLAGRHNGVWGGCWCTYFHRGVDDAERKQLGNQAYKQRLVEQDRAHAALVFDGDVAVAWCQFGTVEELPNIHHRKEWEQGVVRRPDFRITCLFVDRRYRRKGVAATAVLGALELIGNARRRARRGLPARSSARQEDVGVVSLQRHPDDVRTARVHLPATEGTGQLRHDQGDPCPPRRRGGVTPLPDQPAPASVLTSPPSR